MSKFFERGKNNRSCSIKKNDAIREIEKKPRERNFFYSFPKVLSFNRVFSSVSLGLIRVLLQTFLAEKSPSSKNLKICPLLRWMKDVVVG